MEEEKKEGKKEGTGVCAARFVSVSGWGPGVSGSQAAYARLCCGFLHHSHYAQPQPSTGATLLRASLPGTTRK